jgi:hypothetical protein
LGKSVRSKKVESCAPARKGGLIGVNVISCEFLKVMEKHYGRGVRDLTNAERIFEDFRRAFNIFFDDERFFNEVCKEYIEYIGE